MRILRTITETYISEEGYEVEKEVEYDEEIDSDKGSETKV